MILEAVLVTLGVIVLFLIVVIGIAIFLANKFFVF